MANFESDTKLLHHLGVGSATAPANLEYALRHQHGGAGSREIALTGTYYQLLFRAQQALSMVDGRVVPDTTVALAANSRDYSFVHNDGAGGADTVLGTEIDGTASTVTADQVANLTMVAGSDEVPAGEYVFLRSTSNGTGVALSVSCSWTYRYQ